MEEGKELEEQHLDDKLTDKQKRFVEEYCIDFNASRAATVAGYSVESARSIGSENLTKPNIKKAISEKLSALTMSAEEAMVRMTDYARGSFKPFMLADEDNNISINLGSEEAQKHIGLIKKLKQTKRTNPEGILDVITEIELHDAKDAVKNVLQLHGKLIDVHKVDHTSLGEKMEQTVIQFTKGNQGNDSIKTQ